ncbi:MAG: tetratricopeptide repeat protein, partial [Actinoallomurus sp.]
MGEREGLRAAVQARLRQVITTRDLSPVLETAALVEARRLAEILHDGADDVPIRYLLGWLHWYRYQALPEGQDRQDLDTAIGMFTPCFLAGIADQNLPEPLLPLLADRAVPTATALLQQALGSADQAVLSATTQLWQHILTATPTDHPNRAGHLNDLGIALRARFERTGAQTDLDSAIGFGREAVGATPTGHPDRAGRLSNLGIALRARFERTGAQTDLDTAIGFGREAVEATPTGHPNRPAYLSNLGNALRIRFGRTGAQTDLDTAIGFGREAV